MTTKCRFVNANFEISFVDGSPMFTGDIRLTGFNVTLGIGDGSSTLDLSLAYDPCLKTNQFNAPGTGRAVFFRSLTTDFEFNGIVNSATYSDGADGKNLRYKIIDPRKLLDSTYVLFKEYYCQIKNQLGMPIPNFFNYAAYKEGGAAVCPPGDDTHNWPRVNGSCPGYGTSGIFGSSSQNGISIAKVLQAMATGLQVTTNGGDKLWLDLSRLALRVNNMAPWSKTDSPGMTIGALIAQAAEDSACDFIVTLERGGIVVVWPIDRSTVIVGNPIYNIASAYKQSGTLLSLELGENELYEPTNKIIIGDKVTYMSEVDCREGRASMMLGYDTDGFPVRVKVVPGKHFTTKINTSSLSSIVPGFPAMTEISEREILCAATQEMWTIYGKCIDNQNSLSAKLLKALGLDGNDLEPVLNAFNAMMALPANAPDGPDGWKAKCDVLKTLNKTVAKRRAFVQYVECWKWFNNFINEYYGKKWLIPIKNFCIYPANYPTVLKGDGGPYQISDVPTDSGYPSNEQRGRGILGLDWNNALLFEAQDGKYQGFVRVDLTKVFKRKINKEEFDFGVALDELSPGNFIIQNNDLYMKINSEGEIHGNQGVPEVLVESGMIPMAPKLKPEDQNDFINKGLQAMAALFGVAKFNNRGNNNTGYQNVSQLNIFKLNNLAGDLDYATVPMKSNMYVYGPWVDSTAGGVGSGFISLEGSIGATEVTIESQLNPWNYGSMAAMNAAGEGLVEMGLRLYNKDFTGSFKIAEPPGLSVRDFIVNYGLLVSSINVMFGSSGVTTDVSFKTFVPRFGQAGKAISDLMLEGAKARSSVLGHFKNMRRKSISEMYSLVFGVLKETTKVEKRHAIVEGPTPYFVLIGGARGNEENNSSSGSGSGSPVTQKNYLICPDDICQDPPKPSEASDGGSSKPKICDVELEHGNMAEWSYTADAYKLRCIMTLDGILAPVSIKGRGGWISKYADFTPTLDKLARPRPPMPPWNNREQLSINQTYLNPILSTTILNGWGEKRGSSTDGFFVRFISFGEDINKIDDKESRNKADDFGFYSLKGPLVLQAWGYDTEGKPIPNVIDSPSQAEKGIFNKNGTKNKFMSNWLENQKTWPVGPIDLRWDRDRGVWVCPPQERIVVAELREPLSSLGSAEASLLNPYSGNGMFYDNYSIFGPNGENLGSQIEAIKITVCDFLGRNLCAGTKIYAYYNDGKYIVLESSAVDETSCAAACECQESSSSEESSSEESTTETPSQCPDDPCGISQCLSGLGDGILGIKDGCITVYPTTECPASPPPSPGGG